MNQKLNTTKHKHPHSEIGTTNCTKTITKTDLLLKILLTPEGKCK